MKLNICPHNAIHIMLLNCTADGDQQPFQSLLLLLRNPLCRKFTRKCLKCRTNLEDLVDITNRNTCHVCTAPRYSNDIALLFQFADRLAHRSAADQQLIGKIIFLQPLTRF